MLVHSLEKKFKEATYKAFPELRDVDFKVDITPCAQEQYGHYQFNSCMKLAKPLKLSPRVIADKIKEHVNVDASKELKMIGKLDIAGAGFINITLTNAYLTSEVNAMLRDPHLGVDKPKHPQKIIVEFSSPNTAKELHVGHLRSTIIGDCLARLFEYLGHDVLRLNHIGDWGTAFGMLIAYLKENHPNVITGKENTDLSHLMAWYKASKVKFDSDPTFKKRAQLEVVALQGGEESSRKAWEMICDISRRSYQEIYDLLDVKLTERGESFYNPMLADVVNELETKGLITLSEGAKCIFMEGFKNREGNILPLMVQKSDGGYNYDTTDIAAMKHRIEVEKADRIIIITDSGQSLHFKMLAEACELAGYLDPKKVRFDHVTFGLVLKPDGTKFKTREGDTEKFIDLLNNAIKKAHDILEDRSSEIVGEEKNSIAKALGLGAVKYADLSCNRLSDYVFSYERMLRFEGNTAAYLMYSYVRIAGINRKIGTPLDISMKDNSIVLEHPSEIALGFHLLKFEQALVQVAQELLPNRLSDYLYHLAEKFNAFFRDCRVEGSEQQLSRQLLCHLTAITLKQGLHLLGVETVNRM